MPFSLAKSLSNFSCLNLLDLGFVIPLAYSFFFELLCYLYLECPYPNQTGYPSFIEFKAGATTAVLFPCTVVSAMLKFRTSSISNVTVLYINVNMSYN
jgi:hypothetical protein